LNPHTDPSEEGYFAHLATSFVDIYRLGYDAGLRAAAHRNDMDKLRSITSEDLKEIVKRTVKVVND
jgi:hypothetical protein